MRRRILVTSITAGAAAVLLASAAVATAMTATPDVSSAAPTATAASTGVSPTATRDPDLRPAPGATQTPEAVASQAPAGEPSAGIAPVAPADEPTERSDVVVMTRCVDEQLTMAYDPRPDRSGTGKYGFALVFTNTWPTACSFDGWPGLIAVDAAGNRIGGPGLATGASSELVVIEPAGSAESAVDGLVAGAFDCTTTEAVGLRAFLTSDGAGPGVALTRPFTVCADDRSMFLVGALVPR